MYKSVDEQRYTCGCYQLPLDYLFLAATRLSTSIDDTANKLMDYSRQDSLCDGYQQSTTSHHLHPSFLPTPTFPSSLPGICKTKGDYPPVGGQKVEHGHQYQCGRWTATPSDRSANLWESTLTYPFSPTPCIGTDSMASPEMRRKYLRKNRTIHFMCSPLIFFLLCNRKKEKPLHYILIVTLAQWTSAKETNNKGSSNECLNGSTRSYRWARAARVLSIPLLSSSRRPHAPAGGKLFVIFVAKTLPPPDGAAEWSGRSRDTPQSLHCIFANDTPHTL